MHKENPQSQNTDDNGNAPLGGVSPSLPIDEAFRAAQDEICFYGMAGRKNQSKRAIMEAGFEAGYRYAQHRLKGIGD